MNRLKTLFFLVTMLHFGNSSLSAQAIQATIDTQFSYSDTIQVPILFDNISTPIGSITLGINYDTAALSLLSFNTATNLGGFLFSNTQQAGRIIFAWFSLTPISQPIVFGTAKFLRKNATCDTPIAWATLPNELVSDVLGNPLAVQKINGATYFLNIETPNLVYPTPEATNIPINTLFRWNGYDLSCVENYRYQLAADSNFTQIITDAPVSDTTFAVTNMQELTPYFWRVGKVDAKQDVYWSDTLRFFTESTDTVFVGLLDVLAFSDTAVVPLLIQNEASISRFDVTILYDTTQTEFLTLTAGAAMPLGFSFSDTAIGTLGKVQVHWQTPDYPLIIPSDSLLFLHFKKKTNCEAAVTFDTSAAATIFYFYQNIALKRVIENGSMTFVNTVPTALTAPQDSSTQVFIRPLLEWDSIGCTNNYRLQLFDFAQNLLLDSLLSTTNFVPTFLNGDTTYFWRVGRYNVLDSLFWSPTWEFRTEPVLNVQVKAFDITTFSDTFSVALVVDSLQNAIAFELKLNYDTAAIAFLNSFDTTDLISNLQIEQLGGVLTLRWNSVDSTLNNVANILSDTLVQLRFLKLNSCQTALNWQPSSDFYHINDNINIDATFDDATFTFLNTAAPALLLPIANDTVRYPDFEWQTSPCAVQYQLQIATDAQFLQVSLDTFLNDTTFWAVNLAAETPYFWRVGKQDLVGNIFWSDTLSFFTAADYRTTLRTDSILTYQDTAYTTVTLDSAFFLTGFQLVLNHVPNGLTFVGLTDTLFANIQTQATNGTLTLTWSDTLPRFVVSDILLKIKWLKAAECESFVTWDEANSFFSYRENAISDSLLFKNGRVEFLNTAAPLTVSPAANASEVYPILNFEWQAVACSENYHLQIALNNNFQDLILDSLTQTTNINDLVLNHNRTYFWRVGRIDTQGDIYWSDTLNFSTENLPDAVFEFEDLQLFQDTITVAITAQNLVWASAMQLQFQFDTLAFTFLDTSNASLPFVVQQQGDTLRLEWTAASQQLTDTLSLASATLVRLRFLPNKDCFSNFIWDTENTTVKYWNDSTSVNVQTTDGAAIWVNTAAPILQIPHNDTAFISTAPTLRWQPILCTVRYALVVSTDSTFLQTNALIVSEDSLTQTAFSLQDLEHNQTYFWRIARYDSDGVPHYSEVWRFKTDLKAPESTDNFLIYPNPTQGQLTIWFETPQNSETSISIYNAAGGLVWQQQFQASGKEIQLQLNELIRGVYFLRLQNSSQTWTRRIVFIP